MQPELSVVIPVYNERDTVTEIVRRVLRVSLDMEVILVDDGSTDGSPDVVRRLAEEHENVKAVLRLRNEGKGAALRAGFAVASGRIVIVQDADLEYDPRDYARLVQPVLEGRADSVYGSRFRAGRPAGTYLSNYVANRLLTILSNLTTGLRLTDMETCYKVFRRDVVARLDIREDRFGFEPEVTARLAGLGVRVHEVPIRYAGRRRSEGKKIGWRDGVRAVWCILRYSPCRGGSGPRRRDSR